MVYSNSMAWYVRRFKMSFFNGFSNLILWTSFQNILLTNKNNRVINGITETAVFTDMNDLLINKNSDLKANI